ncbi:MAG: hypothetical protein ABSG15_01905 [FCB group bacterium]|jgi:hypothetical protein
MKKLFLLLLIFLAACASSKPPKTYKFENFRIYNQNFENVWASSVQWFSDKNIPVNTTEKNMGHLATDYTLNIDSVKHYLDCGESGFGESIVEYTAFINVYVKKINEEKTKVSISIIYKGISQTQISVNLGKEKINCNSKGVLEKELLDYVEMKK